MGCPKIAYSQYSNPAMRCVYNAADGQESYAGTYSYNTTLKDGMYYVHPDHLGRFVTLPMRQAQLSRNVPLMHGAIAYLYKKTII